MTVSEIMALYLKHRPRTFASIVGQEHIVQTLKNQLLTNRVAHAYLFSGPRGVGKTTTARILAKAINCPNRKPDSPEPCDSCNSCQEIRGSNSIDVIEIDAASHTGVDNVRENIIDNAQFRPTKLKKKIFIIDEAHMLSTASFNALLKTLEEPPAHVVFILATTEKHKLPDTIISRCQCFDYKKIPYDTLKAYLEKIGKEENVKIDNEVIDRIINKSDGCARDAISLLDQLMATGEKRLTAEAATVILPTFNVDETLAFVQSLIAKDAGACLSKIGRLAADGRQMQQFASDVIELLRVLLISSVSDIPASVIDVTKDAKKELKKLSSAITQSELVRLIDVFLERRAQIPTAPLPQLPVELAVIEWCRPTNVNTNSTNIDGGEDSKMGVISDRATSGDSGGDSGGDSAGDSAISDKMEIVGEFEPTPEKKSLTAKVRELVRKNPTFTLEQAQAAWKTCCDAVSQNSPSLAFILNMTELVRLEADTLVLKVQYSFHRDKLVEHVCRNRLETLLAEHLQSQAQILVEVLEQSSDAPDKELQDLAAAFGGEIVQ